MPEAMLGIPERVLRLELCLLKLIDVMNNHGEVEEFNTEETEIFLLKMAAVLDTVEALGEDPL